ncbi:MAG: hypothetical protein U1F10_07800 [Burkholderiales bacterium]
MGTLTLLVVCGILLAVTWPLALLLLLLALGFVLALVAIPFVLAALALGVVAWIVLLPLQLLAG